MRPIEVTVAFEEETLAAVDDACEIGPYPDREAFVAEAVRRATVG